MTYFIVEAPYDKCFELFFDNDLGYPNFYRLSELLSSDEAYQNLTLLAPYPSKEAPILEKIAARVTGLGMKHFPFGDNVDTAFLFNTEGQLQISEPFKQALNLAVNQFLKH
ncbi:MAG: hypothetical protein AB7V32_07950 [Candidatus Berkiella sp.]